MGPGRYKYMAIETTAIVCAIKSRPYRASDTIRELFIIGETRPDLNNQYNNVHDTATWRQSRV